MSPILSLEELPDIDTFTLQEKIEELEEHPHAQMYEQILALAQIELNQRYKVEEFGRKLINDEIPVLPDLSFIKSKVQLTTQIPTERPRKLNFTQCLKKSLITDQTILIKKSAVGHHRYQQKKVVEERSKKQKKSVSYNTMKSMGTGKKNLPFSKSSNSMKKQPLNSVSSKDTIQTLPPIHKLAEIKQSCRKIQKNENKTLSIRYVENDIYDDENPILDSPQQLVNIVLEDDQGSKNISETQSCTNHFQQKQKQLIPKQKQSIPSQKQYIPKQQQTQSFINWQEKVNLQLPTHQKQFNKYRQSKFPLITNKSELKQDEQNRQDNSIGIKMQQIEDENQTQQNKQDCQQSKEQQQKEQKIDELQENSVEKPSKTVRLNIRNRYKSMSQKNMNQKVIISPKLDEQDLNFNHLTQNQFKFPQSKSDQRKDREQKIQVNFRKSQAIERKLQKMITTPPIRSYYNYHEHITCFNKLFPHSCAGSMINDLRNIEEQLKDHLKKQISSLAQCDQYLCIRDQQLMFKVISECENARKYSHYFGIDLNSFNERAKIMISRIHGTKDIASQKYSEKDVLLYRVVRQKQDVYDIVNSTFHRTKQWYELPHGMDLKTSWNLLWTWSRPQIDLKYLCYFQKVNHFFGNKEIARKDLLKKNIEKIKKLGKKAKQAFDIIPETFYLPGENMPFVRKFRQCAIKEGSSNFWIMKPVGMSRGRGIELVNRIQDIVFSQPVVLQKYLMNPLLLNGHKFDLRIYVLVTSINPLQAYIYKEGFARISTQKYSTEESDLTNKFIHLTNFSIQKENVGDQEHQKRINKNVGCMSSTENLIGGCKITLKCLKEKLSAMQINWQQQIIPQIQSIVLKSLISTMNSIPPNPNCFELFGYDIMIDENLKCWLIQVNSSPSLEKDFLIDEIVKQQLVDDIIEIVEPIPYDRKRLLQIVTRRRKQLEGLKSHINHSNNSVQQLNADLDYILHSKTLEKSENKGQNFTQVAPSLAYQNLIKLVQQYKIESIVKNK